MKRLAILPLFCLLAVGCANQQTLERRVNSAVTLYVGTGGDKVTERAVRVTEVANIFKAVAAPQDVVLDNDQLRAAVVVAIQTKYRDDPQKKNLHMTIATILLNELDVSMVMPEAPPIISEAKRLALVVADAAIAAAKPFLKEPT